MKHNLILTCEHGGAEIPNAYKKLFKGHSKILKTHRGLDIGALPVALLLSRILRSPVYFSKVSRLLVDLNRRLDSPTLFSEFTAGLNDIEKTRVLEKYYFPHWNKIAQQVLSRSKKTQLVHVGVHSMTNNLNGNIRTMQLAILYNPKRKSEKRFATIWIRELRQEFPGFEIVRNNPYQGAKGGLTGYFREILNEDQYLGLELEMNQSYLLSLKSKRQRLQFAQALAKSLQKTLSQI